ncbi:MAG: tetratricopeptide repeat protein [Rickettsia endosymbiont of Argas persicus]
MLTGLEILGIFKNFTSNIQIQQYYYILDQQIKELFFFQEALFNTGPSNFYEETINSFKLFIEKNYFSSIKSIDLKLKDDESIKYYGEAIEWLKQYPNQDEISDTKSTCYSKIGNIFSKAGDHKKALACYDYALKYNENSIEIYKKIAYELVELQKHELAIKYYKIVDHFDIQFTEILECFTYLINNASSKEKVKLYEQKGDYLYSKAPQEAALAYSLAQSLELEPHKKHDLLSKQIKAVKKTLDLEATPEQILFEERYTDLAEVIGEHLEI